MINMTDTSTQTWYQRFKKARRKKVKIWGRSLTRSLANFLGRQSLVGDTPVLNSNYFPFLTSFTENWETIRAEVIEILKYREAIPAFHDISPDQKKISTGTNWRTFILFGFGLQLLAPE